MWTVYIHRGGGICWRMVDLLRSTPQSKVILSQKLSTVNSSLVGIVSPSPLLCWMLIGLALCRFVQAATAVGEPRGHVMLRRCHFPLSIPTDSSQSLRPSPGLVTEPWETMWCKHPFCGWARHRHVVYTLRLVISFCISHCLLHRNFLSLDACMTFSKE